MQISNNSIYAPGALTINGKSQENRQAQGHPSGSSSAIDDSFGLSANSTFQSLLKFESVQKFVELDEDGTYSFNWSPQDGVLDTQQQVARNFIEGTNGSLQMPDGAHVYHQADLDLFKQLTGYNLVQTPSGLETILDDSGMPPSPSDSAKIDAAWQLIAAVGSARQEGALDGTLTLDELPKILDRFGVTGLDEDVVEDLLKELMNLLGADSANLQSLKKQTQIGSEGGTITTWSWSNPYASNSSEDAISDALGLIS